ncbi:MAG TPA: Crp/Fnr family transcriptional regulator [Gaiellaceae bacterium]|nr:Crp/Fnr family transcriptional regulator [Gaiellaceae bacterium]
MRWHLLRDVPDEDVRRLLSIARRRTFAPGEAVFHRDDPGDSVHLISKGRFAIRIATPVGDTATLAIRGPGEAFGEMALVAAEPRRTATVTALESAETFCVYQTDFDRLRRDHPSVESVLLAFLVSEIRMLNDRLLEALYVPAERRVLRRVVDLSVTYRQEAGAEIVLTQEELAGLAGTSRSTVNRVLREEERRGTLSLGRGRIVVHDRDDVARRARLPSVPARAADRISEVAAAGSGVSIASD